MRSLVRTFLFSVYIIAAGLTLLLGPSVRAENGVLFELIVRQKPEIIDKYFEITRDTVEVPLGERLHTFLVNFNLEIDLEKIDSQYVEFNYHLLTIGKNPFNTANRFKIEFNLPARVENIPGKNNSLYQLLISPRELIDIDLESCPYSFEGTDEFTFDPSPNFDIYYIKRTVADFHWNSVKGYLEADYTQFKNLVDLTDPGKISYYLCPCPFPGINWDKRFGYAIDPGRSRVLSIYSHDFVSTDALLSNMLKLYQRWGYAPPFLVEGLASYFEFSEYKIKKAAELNSLPPVKELLTSNGYYSADPILAENIAASFVKYLVNRYGISNLRDIYERSDDLTLAKNIQMIYEKSLDTLENEWLHYKDTVSLARRQIDFYAARAGALFRTDQQIEYLKEMTKYDSSRSDSIDTWQKLNMALYQNGHYYEAVEGYQKLIKMDKPSAVYWQIIGNINMNNGEYDKAWKAFDSVYSFDTTYATSKLLQARILSYRGDTAKAVEIAEKYYSVEKSTPGKIEFLLFLGDVYGTRGNNYDSLKAHRNYSDALAWCNEVMMRNPEDPTYHLRAGRAYLGLMDYVEAEKFLELAVFIDTRSYHLGHALLELGKLYDLQGKRERALEYYQAGLANQSAVYHHELCRRYIDKPFIH
jgi:tetratricopeptide (TPR) repeat protein